MSAPSASRLLVVSATLESLAVTGALGCLAGAAETATRPSGLAGLVERAAWVGLAACCAWFALAVAAAARDLAAHPVRPAPRTLRSCLRPGFVRSLLVLLLGGALVPPPPAPGLPPAAAGTDPAGPWQALDGLPLPRLPLTPQHRPRRPHPPVTVRVRPGDCLWTITADLLDPRATDADVLRAWPVLWSANAAAVGPDPDLLHPGTRLRVPPTLPDGDPR